MKKVFIFLAVLFSVQVAVAQVDFCIGPKIGYQSQTLSGKKADIKASFDNNFTAGLFARATIGKFIVQPELLFFKTGKTFDLSTDVSADLQGVSVKPIIKLNQTNMAFPIMLGYQFFDAKLLKIRGNVGPVIYFVLAQEQSKENVDESLKMEKIETNNVTCGAALNVGIDLWRVTLDINYSFGLSNMFGESIDFYSPSTGKPKSINLDSSKQNIFTVTFGLKLL